MRSERPAPSGPRSRTRSGEAGGRRQPDRRSRDAEPGRWRSHPGSLKYGAFVCEEEAGEMGMRAARDGS